jgi:hypothetical protein
MAISLNLRPRPKLLPPKQKAAARNGIDAAKHRAESRFARSIFAYQSMNFAFFKFERNIIDGGRNAEPLR